VSLSRVLVANRGEIAVRIIRAARDLGLETVAVYTEPDAQALHVSMADQAVGIGPAKAYLDSDRIVRAARDSHADAVHPGYGFLAENAGFARACAAAGLTFVGPSADAIAAMGDKVAARRIATAARVPTVPGSDGPVDAATARAVAEDIGYPLVVKAAGGGGGRGIRVVHGVDDLDGALAAGRREAQAAFGDATMYVERFLSDARHIEVQVLGDGAAAVHLFERDCSLQRNRQKVVEEGPSPVLAADLREAMAGSAVRLVESVGYHGAGTVEFLFDPATNAFFFIEMNTRIQVEHPVTEVLTGIDLVAAQLRLAAGEPLWLDQRDITVRGWALECRINAEDPANDFFPQPGVVERLRLPSGPWVRVDTALTEGCEIPPFYDSMIAKVIVTGEDRATAIDRCRRALDELTVAPIATTAPMLRALLDEPAFGAGDCSTTFLERWIDETWKDATT
jgi:acetyl-CoA carboxylase biotin carboxylase subunit